MLVREPDNVKWQNPEGYPFEFHHVDGTEESLVVPTAKGNENSKKNKKEINRVVSDELVVCRFCSSVSTLVQFLPSKPNSFVSAKHKNMHELSPLGFGTKLLHLRDLQIVPFICWVFLTTQYQYVITLLQNW